MYELEHSEKMKVIEEKQKILKEKEQNFEFLKQLIEIGLDEKLQIHDFCKQIVLDALDLAEFQGNPSQSGQRKSLPLF